MANKDENGLNQRQKMFVNHYLAIGTDTYLNGNQAAIAAGYSKKTARTMASELLTNPNIKPLIDAHYEESHLKTTEALKLLGEQSRSEYHKFINEQGEVDLKALKAAGLGHLIRGVKKTQFGNEVQFYDGQKALAMVAKHLGLLDDNITVKVENELGELLGILEDELDDDTFERVLSRLNQESSE